MINQNYQNLKQNYLFAEIDKRTEAFCAANPETPLIRMGIGDVTLPLPEASVRAMHAAVDEMGRKETFRGYGPYRGYSFLQKAVCDFYAKFGVERVPDEIFVSDGAKSDVGNITELFSNDITVVVPDPVYPVYVDTNLMMGREIIYVSGNQQNNFLPMPDGRHADLIYMCSPNNPTGAVYSREQLKAWVDYALENNAVILFDSAYETFISDPALPHTIFEVEGADRCAIEFCSFSKPASFTGTRCAYTVVPMALQRDGASMNAMWLRRQSAKFNGVSYITQRGAEAVFTEEGQRQVKEHIDYYRRNAAVIARTMDELGIFYTGGKNSPYIWLKCPNDDSWAFFDALLNKAHVVTTPGAGFGQSGEGFLRITGFNNYENTLEAMKRFKKLVAE